jgi:hypothetical protein
MSSNATLDRGQIERLFVLLNGELARTEVRGELYLVGGAVMCLALNARDATRDVDAYFKPTRAIREAAVRVANAAAVPEGWLNDAVKRYLGARGAFDRYAELSHLQIFVAVPAYLLAMKCMALRLGAEFHDIDDVRFLIRYLNLTTAEEAMTVVTSYFDSDTIPVKTQLVEELLGR